MEAARDAELEAPVHLSVGYGRLLRANADFRRLWLGAIVSLLGDWFNTIALYDLVSRLTGSPFAMGAVFLAKLLPWVVASPFAGLLVDRVDRKRILIGADLLRAVIVLGFLWIDAPGEVAWIYVLTVLQVTAGAAFQPAQSATLPNITTAEELVTANALMSATWSVLLTLGAALGGLASAYLEMRWVFLLDSLSYVASALLIARVRIPRLAPPEALGGWRRAGREMLEGWRYLRARPALLRIALTKASWALGGGGLVYLLTMVGRELTPLRYGLGIGLLFAARGIGTGVGPVVARRFFRDARRWPLLFGWCVLASGVCYALVSRLPWGAYMALFITAAHAASGMNWMLSSVLMQRRTDDAFRGRVFSAELLVLMLVESASILAASLLLESARLGLRDVIGLMAALQAACGAGLLLLMAPYRRAYAALRLKP